GVMAMVRPIGWTSGDTLDSLRRSRRDSDGCLRHPCTLRNRAAIVADYPPVMPMKVNRMTVHAQIGETDSNPLVQLHDQWIGAGPDAAVECEHIEIGHDIRVRR